MRLSRKMAIIQQGKEEIITGTQIGTLSNGTIFYLKENGIDIPWQVIDDSTSDMMVVMRVDALPISANIYESRTQHSNTQLYGSSQINDVLTNTVYDYFTDYIKNKMVSVQQQYEYYVFPNTSSNIEFVWTKLFCLTKTQMMYTYLNTAQRRKKKYTGGSSDINWWVWGIISVQDYYLRQYINGDGDIWGEQIGGGMVSNLTNYIVPAMCLEVDTLVQI